MKYYVQVIPFFILLYKQNIQRREEEEVAAAPAVTSQIAATIFCIMWIIEVYCNAYKLIVKIQLLFATYNDNQTYGIDFYRTHYDLQIRLKII